MSLNKIYILLLFIAVSFSGCKDDIINDKDNGGWLSVEFNTDKSLWESRSGNGSEYSLEIKKSDGTHVINFEDCSELDDRILLEVGNYIITATSGEDVVAAFDSPFYKDEQEVEIKSAVTKAISMECTLANVKVSVEYSQKVKDNFVDYYLEVTEPNSNETLTFIKDETKSGYFKVNNDNSLTWLLTLNNGQEIYHITKTETNVQARQHYKYFFDVNEQGTEDDGAFIGGIVLDTTTNTVEHLYEVILGDKTPKPEIEGVGFELDRDFNILDIARGVSAKVNVFAQSKIQNLILTHSSGLLLEMGIPHRVNLVNISPELISTLNSLGVSWSSSILDEQEAWIDFSGLFNNTGLTLGQYPIEISVGDARNRTISETLKAAVIPDIDHIVNETEKYNVWATFTTINAKWYTIELPQEFAIQYSTDQENWTNAVNITYNDSEKTARAILTNLQPNTTYYYRTYSENNPSETVYNFTTEGLMQIPNSNFNLWHYEGNVPYPNSDLSAENFWWDSGNSGTAVLGATPTTEEKDDTVDGSAVRLETTLVSAIGGLVKKMGAGNLFTGKFGKISGVGAELDFGKEYSYRPTTLKGYFKYMPVNIDRIENSDYNYLEGKLDSCHIYIALCDWTAPFKVNTNNGTFVDFNDDSILAFGELKESKVMSVYEQFTIDIKYRDITRTPKYILIVASSSKYGDFFTGGIGSTLLIDEFELGFDYPEN